MLSENYIQRLKNLAGIELLSEIDNRKVIVEKIWLPSVIADWAHNLSDKYSIWIANTFKIEFFKTNSVFLSMIPDVKDQVIKMMSVGKTPVRLIKEMENQTRRMTNQYEYILDWLRGRNAPPVREADQINFKTLTYEEASRRAHAWHAELGKLQGGTIKDEDGEVVMTFPDGFYWISLGKARCEKEAQAMGHCGTGRGILYSLRREQHPYITVDLVNGVIGQIKGRANTKPKPEFHQYIIPFLLDKKLNVQYLKSSYQPQTDFELTDLTDGQLNDIIQKKPFLLTGSESATRRLTPEVLSSVLNLILKNYPDYFRSHWTSFLSETGIDIVVRMRLTEYILQNHLSWFKFEYGKQRVNLERWPLTEVQKDFIIDKQEEGEIDVLDSVQLSNMGFTKKQIEKMVKEMPGLFDPRKQDLEALGITSKGIAYIISKSPGTIPEKTVEGILDAEGMKSLFKKNPEWTKSVYLQAKYRGYEGVKGLKESSSGGFKPDHVEILYSEWSDEELGGLFDDDDKRRIESITGDDSLYDNYDYSFNDIRNNMSDLDAENVAYVRYLLKKAFTENIVDINKKKAITNTIQNIKINNLDDILSDPDSFKDEHETEDYNEYIIEGLKTALTRAVEGAQRSADESAVWNEFVKPVKEFLGEPVWVKKKVKKYDKETSKSKMEEDSFLKFKMPYNKFLDLLKVYEDVESSDDEYTILTTDNQIYPSSIIRQGLKEGDGPLSMRDLSYVSGSMEDADLNERFGDRIYDELSEELKNAKVVKKKKKS